MRNMATRKFRCKVCGYVHEGDSAPDKCPVCQAPASEFEEVTEGKPDKKLNTNSNTYTIVYAAVMVIVVAFLLAFVNSGLRDKQDENIRLDTKKQILSSLGITSDNAGADYDRYVKRDVLIDPETGMETEEVPAADFSTNYDNEAKAGRLHVFVCDVDGETKYVIPVNGAGLWGAIWGYVALDADKQTVYGTYFSHASETPGLGAEIAGEAFQDQFNGKKVMDGGNVALSVVKHGTSEGSEFKVDGISGGTITSDGVNNMLHTCLHNYVNFLTAK